MEEVYKNIPGYEGVYQVSNLGNVKSFKKDKEVRILKSNKNSRGYLVVGLSKDGKVKHLTVHQLVAITFLNHKPDGYKIQVDHINREKLDNRLENLQLLNSREHSTKDRKVGGSSKYVGVNWHKSSNKWIAKIWVDGKSKYLGLFEDEYEAHLAYQSALKVLT